MRYVELGGARSVESRRSRQGLLGRVGSRWGEAVEARNVVVRCVEVRSVTARRSRRGEARFDGLRHG